MSNLNPKQFKPGQAYAPEDISAYDGWSPTDADSSWLRKVYGADTTFEYAEVPLKQVVYGGGDRFIDNDPDADEAYIAEMAQQVHRLPPVLVDAEHVVNDGNHRMQAHERAGSDVVPVIRPRPL